MASLVGSFNAMTRRLAQARAATEAKPARAGKRSASTRDRAGAAVVGRHDGRRPATAAHRQPGRRQILRVDLDGYLGALRGAGAGVAAARTVRGDARRAAARHQAEWREEITLYGGEGRQALLCRVSPLPAVDGGHVLVFDDVTTLVKAQRDAAWGEVARRLAHEIKNPLTPIQLSAERLRRKFLKTMPG